MTTILIADDHPVVRDGLKSLIRREPEFEVIGEANDGEEAISMAQSLRPDVLLLDIGMPKKNGLSVLQEIKTSLPGTHVLILSQYDLEEYLFTVLRHGALGYLLKETSGEELLSAIRTVAEGKAYISGPMLQALIGEFLDLQDASMKLKNALTSREEEVMKLLAEGRTCRAISDRLGISIKTAQTYRYRIMEKLNLHNQTEIVKFAMSKGLV